MDPRTADDIGKLVARLSLGVLVLLHGIAKLIGGIGGLEGLLQQAGLPALLAYGVYLGEVIGPLLLIAGWYARIGAALVVINMLFAIALVHAHELAMLNDNGGWQLELQGMFLFTAAALALTGPGRLSVNGR